MNFPQLVLLHSKQLAQRIRDEIQLQGGTISFAKFMELALYAPGLGYYSAGAHKLGRLGDFITAPELSPLFAQCIAKAYGHMLKTLPDFLELGGGSGVFARDILLALEHMDCLPQRYLILEVSADLRERQQALLKKDCPQLFSRITWLDQLPSEKLSGVIFANEVLDAFPIHCFSIVDKEVFERSVTWENDHFQWKLTPPTSPLFTMQLEQVRAECHLVDGYTSEISLMIPAWMQSLANSLKQGILLFFDYGYGRREYYHPDRTQGTLMCYYQHHKHANPFQWVGLQDITAHVDFTQVAESGIAAGLTLAGYTTQSAFLMANGLLDLAQRTQLSETEIFRQNQAIKTLTLPSQMGEAIKVIGFSKNFDLPLPGFSLHDRRWDL